MSKLRSGIGVAFAENMSGYVAAGESDPVAGERGAGRTRAVPFRPRAPDRGPEGFPRSAPARSPNRERRGRMEGPSPGDSSSARRPVVLYRHDPSNRSGAFRLRLCLRGSCRRLSRGGRRKVIFDDRRLDAASDLSTVFLTLRSNGTVRGAGITRVSFGDLLSQLQGLTVTGARTQKEKKDALHAFFGFMNGELCRIYRGSAAVRRVRDDEPAFARRQDLIRSSSRPFVRSGSARSRPDRRPGIQFLEDLIQNGSGGTTRSNSS